MTPDYIEELANLADPDKLWKLGLLQQLDLPAEKRHQLDTGVALRRHASHLRELATALADKQSLLITPLRPNSTAHRSVTTPPEHQMLRDRRDVDDPIH